MRAYVKVFVYVPLSRAVRSIDGRVFEDPLREMLKVIGAMADRGVGVVGNYDNVSFAFAKGTGRYRAIPGSPANPTKGEIGEVHAEEEAVLTFVAPKDAMADVSLDAQLGDAARPRVVSHLVGIEVFDLVRHEWDGLPP